MLNMKLNSVNWRHANANRLCAQRSSARNAEVEGWTWIEVKWSAGGAWLGGSRVEWEIQRLQRIARGGYSRKPPGRGASLVPLESPKCAPIASLGSGRFSVERRHGEASGPVRLEDLPKKN